MYRVIGLLRPDNDFTFDLAATRLREQLGDCTIEREGDRLTIRKGEWWMAMMMATGRDIQMEVEGLVSRLAGVEPAEADAYVSTASRLEVWTDEHDPFMEHFNDYLTVVEVLKSFNGLLAVDPKEPGVL